MKAIKLFLIIASISIIVSCNCYKSNYNIDDIRSRYADNILDKDRSDAAEEAYQYVIEANQAKIKSNYALAILKYQEALKYDSAAIILYDISHCYNALRLYNPAIEFAIESVKKDPDLAEAYKELSTAFLFTYRTEDGLNALKEFTMRKPSNDNIYGLARMYHNFEYYDEALHYYNELYEKLAEPIILINIAHIHLQKKDTVKYLEFAKKSYREDPDQAVLVSDVMMYYWEKKDFDNIFETLQDYKSIAPNTQYSMIFADIVETFMDSLDADQYREVMPKFVDLIDFDLLENDKLTFYTLSYAWQNQDTLKTRQISDFIIENKLDNPLLAKMSFLQFSFDDEDDLNHSLELAEKCIDIHPEDPYFLFTKAQNFFFQKQFKDAIEPLTKAIELDSTNIDYWNFLGYIHHKVGNLAMSDSAYITSLKINPNYPVTNNDYAYYLAEREERLVYAHSLAKKAILYSPKNSSFLDTYAWVCYKMKNYDTAIEYLDKALEYAEEKNLEAIYEHYALIYKDMGKTEKAIKMFTKAIEYTEDKKEKFANEIDELRQNLNE